MKTLSGIYLIKIGPANFYYGSSKNLNSRKTDHIAGLKRQNHHNHKMQKAWNKYKTFDFEIVELCHPDDLMIREQVYLDNSIDNPLNMNISHKALPGFHSSHSNESKKKISQSLKGRKFSKSHREKLSYKRSKETRKKMSEAAKNRSKETVEKIRKTLTGHAVSNETRKKISRKLKGKKLSSIHKKNISRGLLSYYEGNRS